MIRGADTQGRHLFSGLLSHGALVPPLKMRCSALMHLQRTDRMCVMFANSTSLVMSNNCCPYYLYFSNEEENTTYIQNEDIVVIKNFILDKYEIDENKIHISG